MPQLNGVKGTQQWKLQPDKPLWKTRVILETEQLSENKGGGNWSRVKGLFPLLWKKVAIGHSWKNGQGEKEKHLNCDKV